MSKADIVVRCTTLAEALAVCRATNHHIGEELCKSRFADVSSEYGHLDFVLEMKTMCATCWGHYPELCDMDFAPYGLSIVSGWEFLGEAAEAFRSDISLESLLAGGVS